MKKLFMFMLLLCSVLFGLGNSDKTHFDSIEVIALSDEPSEDDSNEFYFDESLHIAEYESKDIKPPNM